MKMKMTKDLARAAGYDVAQRNMRTNGRKKWNAEDYHLGAIEFEKLWPLNKDLKERSVEK